MNKEEIKDLLAKLKRGELCTPNCYGCCGDNELDFAYCPDVADNFEKELANLGYRQIAEDEIVIKKCAYEELRNRAEEVFNEMTERREVEIAVEIKMREHYVEKAKQETAREILQIIKDEYEYIGDLERIICKKYGIEEE